MCYIGIHEFLFTIFVVLCRKGYMVTLVTVTIFRSKPINIVQNRARSACAWSFMYGSDELWDLFNPILNLQVCDTLEMVCIAGDENKVLSEILISIGLMSLMRSCMPCCPLMRAMQTSVSSKYLPCVSMVHQVSTVRVIAFSSRRLLAISSASPSPPQSLLKLANTSS